MQMQKRIAFIAVILMSIAISHIIAQDTIVFKSDKRTAAVIKEINDLEIRYKNFSNPEGPDFVTQKSNIYKIIFKNGEQMQLSKQKKKDGYGRNIISYHLFDFVYQDFSMSYELISKNGKFGYKIPVAVGFGNTDRDGPRLFTNTIYSGFGLNAYIFGQNTISYFIGPEIHVGWGKDDYYYYNYDWEYYGPSYGYEETLEFVYGRLLINNGIAFSPIDNFRLAAVMGLGVRYYNTGKDYYDDDGFRSTAYFTFSMGLRF